MGFQDLNIQLSYAGKGKKILDEFFLPAINEAVQYDRVTSYYTVESLIAISQGIDSLYKKQGKMRLIIGVHSFPVEFIDITVRRQYLRDQIKNIRNQLSEGIVSITDCDTSY